MAAHLIVKTGSAGWVRVTDLPVEGAEATLLFAIRAHSLFSQVFVVTGSKVDAWLTRSGAVLADPNTFAPRTATSYAASRVFA